MAILAGQRLTGSGLAEALREDPVRGQRTTSSTTTTATASTSAQGIMRLQKAMTAGRRYRIAAPSIPAICSAAATLGFQITYTTNGTTPTASSTRLKFAYAECPSASTVETVHLEAFYTPASDLTFTALLSVWRVSGSGNAGSYGASDCPLDFVIEDLGPDGGDVGVDI